MTFVKRTLEYLTPPQLETLRRVPPTEDARILAENIGRIMGMHAYPEDICEEVADKAAKYCLPAEVVSIICNSAAESAAYTAL